MSEQHIVIRKKHLWIAGILVTVVVGSLVLFTATKGKGDTVDTESDAPSTRVTFASAVGQQAPEFSLETIDGSAVQLADLRGKVTVLFFNEGSMCYPGCWNQVRDLASDARLNTDTVKSYSVVVETPGAWQQIMKKKPEYKVNNMLFDTSRKVSRAYDVMSLASSMHKGAYPGHTYVIIDQQGVIRYTLDDPRMAIRNDELAAEVQKLIP